MFLKSQATSYIVIIYSKSNKLPCKIKHDSNAWIYFPYSQDQYGFVYEAILEYWESKDTAVSVTQFCAHQDGGGAHCNCAFEVSAYCTNAIGIDHDTVCAGVVCAFIPAQHECCAGVAAKNTPAQTVCVVDFYSTTKPKQYTAINAAMMDRHAETSVAGSAIAMEASIETASE